MARRVSPERQRAAFIQAGQREIARGGRPLYRLRKDEDGSWTIDGTSGPSFPTAGRSVALDAARAVISTMLEVGPDRFDVVIDEAGGQPA